MLGVDRALKYKGFTGLSHQCQQYLVRLKKCSKLMRGTSARMCRISCSDIPNLHPRSEEYQTGFRVSVFVCILWRNMCTMRLNVPISSLAKALLS